MVILAIVAALAIGPMAQVAAFHVELPRFQFGFGSDGSGEGQFDLPTAVAVDGDGNVYVADQRNHRVQKFNSSGVFLDEWGSSGSGTGEFNQPHDVAVDGDGNVYVADLFDSI